MATIEASATRAAIVTGGPRGIGRSVVRQLAGDGLSLVVVGYGSNYAEADAAVAEAEGAKAITVTADVADEKAVASLFDQAEQAFGGVDVVVNQQAARRVRTGGAIINFWSSVIGRVLPTYTGYAASKAAVEAMTFILAHELCGMDITVNAVAPGPTATDMFLEGKNEELLTQTANAVPLQRLGTPADIAPVLALLASPAGHWINGQTIRVNDGIN